MTSRRAPIMIIRVTIITLLVTNNNQIPTLCRTLTINFWQHPTRTNTSLTAWRNVARSIHRRIPKNTCRTIIILTTSLTIVYITQVTFSICIFNCILTTVTCCALWSICTRETIVKYLLTCFAQFVRNVIISAACYCCKVWY